MTTKRCPDPYHVTEDLLAETGELAIGCMSLAQKVAALLPRPFPPEQRSAMRQILKDTSRLRRKSAALQKRLEAIVAREEARSPTP